MPQIETSLPHLVIQFGNCNFSHIVFGDRISFHETIRIRNRHKSTPSESVKLVYRTVNGELNITNNNTVSDLIWAITEGVNIVDDYLYKGFSPEVAAELIQLHRDYNVSIDGFISPDQSLRQVKAKIKSLLKLF